ncbi:MAG TPA: cysteine--tRNA ligase [Candidatus Saccharimonadales bacterium]|nr:cysteine--tRNA ligase [Candidatus Saccharimonadales bacterium]
MKLHNTLTRQTEEFKPHEAGKVKLYTCGPTVYDYPTIGNLRSFVFDDTLRRALQVAGYEVAHVMNITDVGHLVSDEDEGEDKLEAGAGREQKSVKEISQRYAQAFFEDVKALNILAPNAYRGPHGSYAYATDFIDEQIELVNQLMGKDYAYKTASAIYFDISKLSDYGKLSGQKLSDKEVAARSEVVNDPAKRNPQDFALWFFTVGRFKNHTLRWRSPWGEGFPGWHLECSAIVHATLGEPIDIHTGGVDHIGTHHTNEIAQTEAAFGVKLANYWLHNEHLMVDGQKMSKSKRNFYTLKDVIGKGYEPMALRLLFLQSHYRTQANFTWEVLDAAKDHLQNLRAWADLKHQQKPVVGLVDIRPAKGAIFTDLNTPKALAELASHKESPSQEVLELIDKLLGLHLADRPNITSDEKELIIKREEAREQKDWTGADNYRAQLAKKGIDIKDTETGPIWSRISS